MKISRYLYIIFFLLGCLCLLGAYVIGASTVIGGVLSDLGIVFISIVVLDRVWSALGGEPLQANIAHLETEIQNLKYFFAIVKDAEESGVNRVISRSDDYATPTMWQSLLKNASRNVDLSGTAQHGWLKDGDGFKEIVRRGIAGGCRYRILLYTPLLPSSPPNHPIRQIIETERFRSDVTASHNLDSLKFFLSIRDSLPIETREQFQVRVVNDKVLYTIISRFDDTLLVIFYMYYQRSESSPLLELKGPNTSLFQSYINEFETLWNEKSREITISEILNL